MPHILMLAALRGRVVLGPMRGGRPAFARTAPPPQLTGERRAAALGNLVRRYLQGHGPASVADVAAWSGLGRRDVQAGLDGLVDAPHEDDDLVDLAGRATPPEVLPARLLPAFDPYLLGWRGPQLRGAGRVPAARLPGRWGGTSGGDCRRGRGRHVDAAPRHRAGRPRRTVRAARPSVAGGA